MKQEPNAKKPLKKYYVVVGGGKKQKTILAHYFAVENMAHKLEFFMEGEEDPIHVFSGNEWVEVFD